MVSLVELLPMPLTPLVELLKYPTPYAPSLNCLTILLTCDNLAELPLSIDYYCMYDTRYDTI